VNKLAIREAALVVLLAAATFALTWKAKGLEKRLLGQSDEAVMTNRPAPDFDAQTLSGENVATRDFKGKKKIVFAGLWTSVCIVGPALSAIAEGYEVYVITDACGDVSAEAHNMAIERIVEAGAKPMTSVQYLLELQRDWSRQSTYDAVMSLVKKYGGAYGIGIQYANEMIKH